MTAPTLTEFLLARFDEDSAVDPQYGSLLNIELHEPGCLELGAVERSDAECDCSGPKRWLAEVEAKRRIVAAHPLVQAHNLWGDPVDGVACEVCDEDADLTNGGYVLDATGGCVTLRALALPYADHPDYDEAWRP